MNVQLAYLIFLEKAARSLVHVNVTTRQKCVPGSHLNGMTRTFIAPTFFLFVQAFREKPAQLVEFLILFICFSPIFFFFCYRSVKLKAREELKRRKSD